MITLSVPEFGRIDRDRLSSRLIRRLQSFDERHARKFGKSVFDWSRIHYIQARNYVGVVQVSGLTVEILPKTDAEQDGADNATEPQAEWVSRAQRNLVYMLSVARELPFRDRDLASQRVQRMPMLEVLIQTFVRRLLAELRRGLAHGYIRHEENLSCVKGRLLLEQHLRTNVARNDRLFVGYDEFVPDTWLNRILKAACVTLLKIARSNRNLQHLRESLLTLVDVEDHEIQGYHFDRVHLDRGTERFRPLLEFARLVLSSFNPAASVGATPTFSLLFPMEQVFEEFIGRSIRRFAADLGISRRSVHLQAARRHLWLLNDQNNAGKFRLRPDVIVDDEDGEPCTILDTKWKRLLSDRTDAKNGVSQSDVYQLYAYANRYGTANNVLLFPWVKGVTPKTYHLADDEQNRTLRIEFVDLTADLAHDTKSLRSDLRRAIQQSESLATSP